MPTTPETITCPDCAESLSTECPDCGGYGVITNPEVSMTALRDAIADHGIPATLYMSGGNIATIGVGPTLNHGDGDHWTYLVGPGCYSSDTAHREELSSGPDEWDTSCWNAGSGHYTAIGDHESVTDYAARVVNAYKRHARTNPRT